MASLPQEKRRKVGGTRESKTKQKPLLVSPPKVLARWHLRREVDRGGWKA